MKFIINKKEIIETLKTCNSLVETTSTSPYIQGMLIEAKNNKLTITTSNGLLSCKSEIINNIQIIEDGIVLIKSKLFTNIINKLKFEDITFEKVDNSVLKIKTKSFDSNINIMDEEQYPIISFDYQNWQQITLEPYIFKSIIAKILHSVSMNREKPSVFNGICIESVNNKLNIVGSDTHRLSYLTYDYSGNDFKIVVDTSIFNSLSDIVDVNENILLYISDNSLIVKIKNFTFSSKLIDGEYPNIQPMIKAPRDNSLLVDKKELIDALERGIIISMLEKKPLVNLKMSQDAIIASFKSLDLGSSYEKIKIEDFKGNEMEFNMNAAYLISLLKVIDSSKVRINMSREDKPIILVDENVPNFVQVIISMRN